MDLLETGFLATFGPDRWYTTKIFLQDFSVKREGTDETVTLPGEEVIPKLLPAFENHLREKGWLGKTVFDVQDEPSAHNVMSWREVSDYVRWRCGCLSCSTWTAGMIFIGERRKMEINCGTTAWVCINPAAFRTKR
jgi:hypothetical protein